MAEIEGDYPPTDAEAPLWKFLAGAAPTPPIVPPPAVETLTVATPGAQTAGASMTITGTYTGGPPTAIDYQFNALGFAQAVATISGGTFSFFALAPTAGTNTVSVRDHVNTAVSATSGSFTTIPAGTGGTPPPGTLVVTNVHNAADFKAWVAANQGTLTNPIAAYLWNDTPTSWQGPFNVSGITTSPTTGLTITAAPGQSFADHPDRPLGVPNPANGVCLTQPANYTSTLSITADNVTVTRIQITNAGGSKNCGGLGIAAVNGGGTATVQGCILDDNGQHDSGKLSLNGVGVKLNRTTFIVENNVMPSVKGNGSGGNYLARGIVMSGQAQQTNIVNNTFIKDKDLAAPPNTNNEFFLLTNGKYGDDGFTFANNAVIGAKNDFGYPPVSPYGNNGFSSTPDGHNATDQPAFTSPPLDAATAVGFSPVNPGCTVACLVNVPFDNKLFLGVSTSGGGLDVRLPAGSVLIGAGSAATAPKTDIWGKPRSATAPSIGAMEGAT